MNKIIIDGENAVLGRLASFAAKKSLGGEEIAIVNADKVIITGNRTPILEKYLWKKSLGGSGLSGPFIKATPEKIVKRTVRGMLPYKQARGRAALKRVKCYTGIPQEFASEKMIKAGKGSLGTSVREVASRLKS